jgi:hypothetical protein
MRFVPALVTRVAVGDALALSAAFRLGFDNAFDVGQEHRERPKEALNQFWCFRTLQKLRGPRK